MLRSLSNHFRSKASEATTCVPIRRASTNSAGQEIKITRITAFQVDLPLVEGRYAWSGGKSVDVFDSTVVRIETDKGVTGWGANCPLGPAYLPAYAAGTRAGLKELAPCLLGENPTQLGKINQVMDSAMRGHPYVKSPLDIACWDILGKVAGMPVCELLGGRFGEDFALYRAISQAAPGEMAENIAGYREEGYRKFQLKVGGVADVDIERIKACAEVLQPGDLLMADANTGWLMHDAVRVVNAVKGLDVYIEQPCDTYEENLSARQIRDLCVSLGIAMNIEDTWGGDIETAAISHLAHSTPTQFLFAATDFNSYVTVSTADGAPRRFNGRMAAPKAPGLGIQPRLDVLGEPVLDVGV
ncbi:hypothetical protein CYMTET_49392 [Cymbomonas tetramitiformis]|uniref:Mandelate racemase/muconate lactonizing enzyme C-terminal domain-containing protein n=1 Tax=Cymbomonas tetramitiformis TaxID=36881 RepID=A0AAE0EUR9_9CHLO|nr:hypothetical protein CYMTET_49392 [Cymbomonas tetramitiformis]